MDYIYEYINKYICLCFGSLYTKTWSTRRRAGANSLGFKNRHSCFPSVLWPRFGTANTPKHAVLTTMFPEKCGQQDLSLCDRVWVSHRYGIPSTTHLLEMSYCGKEGEGDKIDCAELENACVCVLEESPFNAGWGILEDVIPV